MFVSFSRQGNTKDLFTYLKKLGATVAVHNSFGTSEIQD